MAKASPNIKSFNAGEFSVLVEGRTDIDRYPASLRKSNNFIGVAQGPLLKRSGTMWMNAAYDEANYSAVAPFIFNETQSLVLEFGALIMRIFSESGLQVYTPVNVTQVLATAPLKLRASGHGSAVNDYVTLTGFPLTSNLQNKTVKVTAVSGTDITLNISVTGPLAAGANTYVSKVYIVTAPYAAADVRNIRYVQSVDVMYLFCPGYRVQKLTRFGAYDWRFTAVLFNDGPYMDADTTGTTITLNGLGSPIPKMTSPTAPIGSVSTDGNDDSSTREFMVFDNDANTYWKSGGTQGGWVQYTFPTATVINGYCIYLTTNPGQNADLSYSIRDRAPGDFRFEGSNDNFVTRDLLDSQVGYVLYTNNRSVWFKLNNAKAYTSYRLTTTACTRNGANKLVIGSLVMSTPNPTPIQLTFNKPDAINNGEGWKTTDVDRLLRIKDDDGVWRAMRIVSRTSATVVSAQLLSEPFTSTGAKLQWRMGYYSDTTGWPLVGVFFADRLFVGGSTATPDLISGSRVGAYEDFQQTTPFDEVLDDSAIAFRLTARKLSGIKWMASDQRGLLIGTGSQEWTVQPSDSNQPLTGRNIKARNTTSRGSANLEPIQSDDAVLFVQTARKTVREMAYVFASDGYKAPSMSMFASHLGAPKFAQMAFAADPHNLAWFRRDDGSAVALTYNRDEDVIGWHTHDFAGGLVESMCVIPSALDDQETLWMVVNRTVNGQMRRYIERLMRTWDFDSTLDEAHFVDCGARYVGTPITQVAGLWWLEGRTVDALADGVKVKDLVVTNGIVTLRNAASNIIIGLRYTAFAEIARIEAGAMDGTAQGKTKRIHSVVLHAWDSAGGEIGRYDEDQGEFKYVPVEYEYYSDEMEDASTRLQTLMSKPMKMPNGYGTRGTVIFQHDDPLPFNVIALMPQLNTQDR